MREKRENGTIHSRSLNTAECPKRKYGKAEISTDRAELLLLQGIGECFCILIYLFNLNLISVMHK